MTPDIATALASPRKVHYLALGDQPYLPGRRANMKYRDLGAADASGGLLRAQVMSTVGAQSGNAWHSHRCEVQFLYILSGWIELEFEPGKPIRMTAGDSIVIPGGTVHRELGGNDGAAMIEMSIPADMGTEPAQPPVTVASAVPAVREASPA